MEYGALLCRLLLLALLVQTAVKLRPRDLARVALHQAGRLSLAGLEDEGLQ